MLQHTTKLCLSGVNLPTLQITAQIKTQKNTERVWEITPPTPAPVSALRCACLLQIFFFFFFPGTHKLYDLLPSYYEHLTREEEREREQGWR